MRRINSFQAEKYAVVQISITYNFNDKLVSWPSLFFNNFFSKIQNLGYMNIVFFLNMSENCF